MKNLLFLFLLPLFALADPGRIELAKAAVDPTSLSLPSALGLEPACSPSMAGTRLYLAQPERNFTAPEKNAVTDLGLSFYGHVPPNAYILEGTEAQIAELREKFSFLYLGEFLPEFKTVCELDDTRFGAASEENPRYVLAAVTRGEFLPAVKRALESEGVEYTVISETVCPALAARLTKAQIDMLAKMGEVASIESYAPPVPLNDAARTFYCANLDDLTMEGYDGSTQTVCLQDSGLDNGDPDNLHPDFKNKNVTGRASTGASSERGGVDNWYDNSGHGTHVAGTMCGTGAASYGQYQGIAPGASLYVLACGASAGLYTGTDADLEMTYEAGCRVMNNSWGNSSNGAYGNVSQRYDTLVWNHKDYTLCFASGNFNTQTDLPTVSTLTAGAASKNGITVGASESYRPDMSPDACPDDGLHQGMFTQSSRGPCADGRIKPDIAAPGTCVVSCNASRERVSERSVYYVSKSGSSMSAPVASGCAAVIRDYLIKNRGLDSPSASLVKAVMLCGARTLYPGQYRLFDEIPPERPNPVEGHGHVNLKESLEPTDGEMLFSERVVSETGQAVTNFFEKHNDADLTVGLVWSDYPGTVSAARALVNDLDLIVVAPNGSASSLNDDVNNAEVIRLPGAPAGRYTVIARGANVMQGPQECSLVFHYGRAKSPYPVEVTVPPDTLWSGLDIDTTAKTRPLSPDYPIPYSTDWAKGYYDRSIYVAAQRTDIPSGEVYELLTSSGEAWGTYAWDYRSLFPTNFPKNAVFVLKYRIFNGNRTFESGTSEADFTVLPEPGVLLCLVLTGICALKKILNFKER